MGATHTQETLELKGPAKPALVKTCKEELERGRREGGVGLDHGTKISQPVKMGLRHSQEADFVGARGSGSWTCFVIFLFGPGGQLGWFPSQHGTDTVGKVGGRRGSGGTLQKEVMFFLEALTSAFGDPFIIFLRLLLWAPWLQRMLGSYPGQPAG